MSEEKNVARLLTDYMYRGSIISDCQHVLVCLFVCLFVFRNGFVIQLTTIYYDWAETLATPNPPRIDVIIPGLVESLYM